MKQRILFAILSVLLTSCIVGPSPQYQSATPYPTKIRATVEIEPTATAVRFEILNLGYKRDTSQNFIVVGILKNIGSTSADFVQVTCWAYDTNGDLVDVSRTYTDPHSLAPGEEATFDLYLDEVRPITEYDCKGFVD